MAEFWKSAAQDYGKINFDFVLMTHIQDTNKQLSKLPHEMLVQNMNDPVGTKYEDIVKSYCNMVHQLEQLLKPYWDPTYLDTMALNEDGFKPMNTRFGFLMELCGRKQFLFTKIRENVDAGNIE
jgi:hypothetical protein